MEIKEVIAMRKLNRRNHRMSLLKALLLRALRRNLFAAPHGKAVRVR
jgi:hypothetical protein